MLVSTGLDTIKQGVEKRRAVHTIISNALNQINEYSVSKEY